MFLCLVKLLGEAVDVLLCLVDVLYSFMLLFFGWTLVDLKVGFPVVVVVVVVVIGAAVVKAVAVEVVVVVAMFGLV